MDIQPQVTLDAIASIATAATSAILAIVALIFSYRQNVGWKPVAFANGSTLSGVGGDMRDFELGVEVEFWNRRKYPIIIRAVRVVVSGANAINNMQFGAEGDYIWGNVIQRKVNKPVSPSEQMVFEFSAPFEGQSLDAMQPTMEFRIAYFDPIRNKDELFVFSHKLFYPEFGWKKSEEERAESTRAYEATHAAKVARTELASENKA